MTLFTDLLKGAWRRAVPERRRAGIALAVERAGDYLRYLAVRSKLLGLFARVGIRPHALFIEGTNICNARCVFCAYPQMERPKATMPQELFAKVVDEYLALGRGEIDLTPIVGDPFVDKHLFERLDLLAARTDVTGFHFYSNVILMKPEAIRRLVGYDRRFTIFCSFGGFDRETYRVVMGVDKFEEAVANIRALIEAKAAAGSAINVQVNLRIPQGNMKGEFADYLMEKQSAGLIRVDGVDNFDNWGGKISDAVLAVAGLVPAPVPDHRGPCFRLLTGPTVLADGRVNACCCRDVEATLIIGDVRARPLKDILSGPEIKDLIARHERGDFPEACKACTRYETIIPSRERLFP
jgi:MoaA/NifB/PqqE/SkfB family radical SAM enzyme